MKRIHFLHFLFSLMTTICLAQKINIRGVISDAATNEGLIGANIVVAERSNGCVSNYSGNFQLSTSVGKISLKCSYVGYETQMISLYLQKDTFLNVTLKALTLQEVIVKGNVPIHQQTLMGFNTVSIEKIKAMPSFFGEPDVMKAITFLPGVQGGRESGSNLYIRGGNRDQNLILMDETPMYNTNHIGGFISIFNTDAIKKVDIYKGGIPAQFGGRLSSVLDIKLKEGNKNERKGKFNLGTLISSLMLEGPIKKQQSSYLFAARFSYLDLIFLKQRLQTARDGYGDTPSYTVGDINFKVNHEFKDKSSIYLHTYVGGDYNNSRSSYGGYSSANGKIISNTSIGIGYNKMIANRCFFHTGLNYANYFGNFFRNFNEFQPSISTEPQRISNFSSKTMLADLSYKARFEFDLNEKNHFKIGLGINRLAYRFGVKSTSEAFYPDENIRIRDTAKILSGNQRPFESAFFVEDEILLAKNLRLNTGVRLAYYQYKSAKYPFVEPRVSLRYMLNENASFKASYMSAQQTGHLMIQKNDDFEREIWVSATQKVLPQRGNQFSIGYFQTFQHFGIEAGVEAYYKTMRNLTEYQQALKFQADFSEWEKSILTGGKGNAYGMEFFVQRNEGKWNGMMSYTLSWSNRQFEQLNHGRVFPSLYDRRHVFNIVGWYEIGKGWSASAQWVFNSGSAFTLPEGLVNRNPYFLNYLAYGDKNNARLPNYHRLDLSIKHEWQNYKKKTRYLSFNIYNTYNRKNATFLFVENNRLKQKSEFPLLPSMSLGTKF